MTAARRDPAALKRATGLMIAILLIWPMLLLCQFKPSTLLDRQNLAAMGNFVRAFLPPDLSSAFLGIVVKATFETLAIATTGVTLACIIAVPIALAMSRSLSVARIGPGPGRLSGEIMRGILRMFVVLLRGIPELVWALLFVRVLGLGATAGVLALALTYGGMLGKVYAEIVESSDTNPIDALLESGSGPVIAFLYGLLPNAASELVSYTVYRWECGIRASVVMGFVGAGGLGQLMDQAMKMLNGGEAATILLVFLLLVLLADAISAWLRKRLA